MIHRKGKARPGIAATEMALLAPVLLTLLMGVWEVGRYVSMQNLLDNAAREAGRLGASGSYLSSNNTASPSGGTITLAPPSTNTACELQQRVLLYLQAAGVSTTGATVQVTNSGGSSGAKGWTYTYTAGGSISGSGYDPTAAANQNDALSVRVTVPYSNVTWSPLSWFVSQGATMSATAGWTSMMDVPLTVSTTIPSQPIQPGDPVP